MCWDSCCSLVSADAPLSPPSPPQLVLVVCATDHAATTPHQAPELLCSLRAEDEVVREQLTRNLQFFGEEGQSRVSGAFVVVVGLGVRHVALPAAGAARAGRQCCVCRGWGRVLFEKERERE